RSKLGPFHDGEHWNLKRVNVEASFVSFGILAPNVSTRQVDSSARGGGTSARCSSREPHIWHRIHPPQPATDPDISCPEHRIIRRLSSLCCPPLYCGSRFIHREAANPPCSTGVR